MPEGVAGPSDSASIVRRELTELDPELGEAMTSGEVDEDDREDEVFQYVEPLQSDETDPPEETVPPSVMSLNEAITRLPDDLKAALEDELRGRFREVRAFGKK